MNHLQSPANDKNLVERVGGFLRAAIAAHPAVTDERARRQAMLLNAITLLLTASSLAGLFASAQNERAFLLLLAVSIVSFLLGKSKYPRLGAYLFSFGSLSVSFLPPEARSDYSTLVLSVAPLALIAASALLNRRAFSWLVVYSIAAAFLPPLYFENALPSNDLLRNGGIVVAIGLVLYGINDFRERLEEARARETRAVKLQLQDLKKELENRALTHAREMEAAKAQIEKHAARIRAAAEISQMLASNVSLPLKDLLTDAAQIISARLGFYHVGVFLLDKDRQYAELFAANSEGGKRMLERRHQLKVGGTGIVGYVAQSGFPRIALSTGADAVYFNNPDLPNTQSEMAVPLILDAKVIGVLDAQSEQPAAFSEEDLNAFNTLAAQIAFAVGAALSAEQPVHARPQASVSGAEKAARGQRGYLYLSDGTITAAKTLKTPALEKALQLGEAVAAPASADSPLPALAAPVKVRDRIVGYIHIESSETGKRWTEDEILLVQAISERAALALENARLFEETERRAEQEQIMARISARIGETNRFDNILQTAIREIGQTLNARRAYIQVETAASEADEMPAEQELK